MQVSALEFTTTVISLYNKGFGDPQESTMSDGVYLMGGNGGSGYGYSDYGDEYDVVIRCDGTWEVTCAISDHQQESAEGDGFADLFKALERLERFHNGEEEATVWTTAPATADYVGTTVMGSKDTGLVYNGEAIREVTLMGLNDPDYPSAGIVGQINRYRSFLGMTTKSREVLELMVNGGEVTNAEEVPA